MKIIIIFIFITLISCNKKEHSHNIYSVEDCTGRICIVEEKNLPGTRVYIIKIDDKEYLYTYSGRSIICLDK